jgi:hypothetical protein
MAWLQVRNVQKPRSNHVNTQNTTRSPREHHVNGPKNPVKPREHRQQPIDGMVAVAKRAKNPIKPREHRVTAAWVRSRGVVGVHVV